MTESSRAFISMQAQPAMAGRSWISVWPGAKTTSSVCPLSRTETAVCHWTYSSDWRVCCAEGGGASSTVCPAPEENAGSSWLVEHQRRFLKDIKWPRASSGNRAGFAPSCEQCSLSFSCSPRYLKALTTSTSTSQQTPVENGVWSSGNPPPPFLCSWRCSTELGD